MAEQRWYKDNPQPERGPVAAATMWLYAVGGFMLLLALIALVGNKLN